MRYLVVRFERSALCAWTHTHTHNAMTPRQTTLVPPAPKRQKLPPEVCECGRRKRPQFDKCYACFNSNKENREPPAPSLSPEELMPPPAPKAPMTALEKELKRLEEWDGEVAWGPRLNTPRLVRYWRVVGPGYKPADPQLLALIEKHDHLYAFNHLGMLVRKNTR